MLLSDEEVMKPAALLSDDEVMGGSKLLTDDEVMSPAGDATWGDTLKAIPDQIAGGAQQAVGGLAQAAATESKPDPVERFIPGPLRIAGQAQRLIKKGAQALAGDENVQAVKEFGQEQYQKGTERIEEATPENQSFWQQAVSTAGVSAGTMLPTGIAAFMLKQPGLMAGTFGVQEFGRAFGDAKAQGLDDIQATRHATASGLLEAGTEYLPAKTLFKAGTGPFKRLVNFMARELPGENIAELGQMASEYINGLEEYTTGQDLIENIKETVKLTSAATLISGGAQSAGVSALDYLARHRKKTPEERDAEAIKNITSAPDVDSAIDAATQSLDTASLDELESETDLEQQLATLEAPDSPPIQPADTIYKSEQAPIQTAAPAAAQPISPQIAADADITQQNQRRDPVRADRGARRQFQQPLAYLEQRHREKVAETMAEAGLTEAQAEAVNKRFAPKVETDKTTGYYEKRNLEPSIERAQQHAAETGEQAFYAEVDMANMGGGNKFYGGSTVKFDREFYTPWAAMLRQEVEATGGDVVSVRAGGDELGFIVVNTTQEQLEAALNRASERTVEMARERGMADIKNPKYADSPERGINLYFGVTPIVQGETAEQIREVADSRVGMNKAERNENVSRIQAQTAGAAAPQGQAGRIESGVPAPDRRVRPEGSGSPAQAAESGEQRESRVDETDDNQNPAETTKSDSRAVAGERDTAGDSERRAVLPVRQERETDRPKAGQVNEQRDAKNLPDKPQASGNGSSPAQTPQKGDAATPESGSTDDGADGGDTESSAGRADADLIADLESGTEAPDQGASSFAQPQKEQSNDQEKTGQAAEVSVAANEAATSPKNDLPEPTEAQREAGNYRKGHIRINGLDISIENPAGSRRRPEWPILKFAYGYFRGTKGKDGDHVDVFLSESATDESLPVFVIDQVNKDGKFDEVKVMMGFANVQAARDAYLSNYPKGWTGLGAITEMSLDDFKKWVKEGDTKNPVGRLTASWVIREKATGKVIMETFDRAKVNALNTKKYEAVPIQEHLAGLNKKKSKTEKDEPRHSKQSTTDKRTLGLPVASVQKVIDEFRESLNGVPEIEYTVVKTQDEAFGEQSREAGRIKGAYHNGRIVLVAENLNGRSDALRVLRHETLAHFGLNTLPAETKAEIIQKIIDARESLKKHWTAADQNYPEASEQVKAEEVFARIAEDIPSQLSKVWNEIVRIIQAALKKLGLIDDTVTMAELRSMVESIAEGIRRGGQQESQRPAPAFSKTGTAPPFFSALKRAAEGLKQDKGTAEQFLSMLKSQPGVKAEELEWTGLEEYLRAQGPKKVTKQEIVDFLEANGVQVETITKEFGESQDPRDKQLNIEGAMEFLYERDGIDPEENYGYSDPEDYVALATRRGFQGFDRGRSSEYEKYQLPGGENYREVLLTLPPKPAKETQETVRGFSVESNDGRFKSTPYPTEGEARARLLQIAQAEKRPFSDFTIKPSEYTYTERKEADNFRSSHFPETPNILAHIRLNDRTDADGNKVLFVEEIQSDWHQKGRKKGYKGKLDHEGARKLFGIDQKVWDGMSQHQRDSYVEEANSGAPHVVEGQVPDAPFKNNAWAELAIKRVLRMAAEEGYDAVAWTTGEQQAERYDLSKQVSRIDYQRIADNEFNIEVRDHGGRPVVEENGVPINRVEDLVGKEIAQKVKESSINTSEWSTLSGLDLKVGGEGMKGFYDKILPNLFKKVAGKLDKAAKVGTSRVGPGKDIHSILITDPMREGALAGQPLFSKTKQKQTNTKAFRDWFGKSVVTVDGEPGSEPLVVYHQTSKDAEAKILEGGFSTAADVARARLSDEQVPNGIFFKPHDRDIGVGASKPDQISQIPVYLSIQKPFVVGSRDELAWHMRTLSKEYAEAEKEHKKIDDKFQPMFDELFGKDDTNETMAATDKLLKDWGTAGKESATKMRALIDKVLADGGYDGMIILKDAGSMGRSTRTFVALRSEQIKSATGNSGRFNPSDPNILFSKTVQPAFKDWKLPDTMAGTFSSLMTKKEKLMTTARQVRRKMQDKFIVWKDVQDQIQKSGGTLSDFSDAYNKFTLIEGKIGDRFKKLFDEHIQPIVQDLTMSGVTIDQLGEYLYAQFAPQRNKRIADINPDMPDGGSGLTNKEAADILAKFTPAETKQLERLAQKVYAMQRFKLDTLVDSGRLTAEVRDELLKDDRYVPLKGFAETADLVVDSAGIGRGFDQAKDVFKRAKGRKTLAAEMLSTSVRDVENAIIAAEKNRVGQSVLKLVMDNPNENLWKVNPIKIEKAFNKSSGQVEQRVITDYKALARDPNVFVTWVKGKPYAIEFRDNPMGESSLARAVKNMGVDNVPKWATYLAKLNRWLSTANTALSPEFLLTNPIRDIQTALAKTYGDYDARIAGQVMKNLPKAIKGSIGGIGESKAAKKVAAANPQLTAYFKEYAAEGGKTDYFRTKTVNEMRNELDFELAAAAKGKKGAAIRAIRSLKHGIENSNAVLENMTRLSLYITLREAGHSKHKAATAAKNVSVNFNRRGEAGAFINSLYLFYNASMQGTALTLRLMRNPKVQKLLVAAGAGMVALTQYNILMGGDDDDGEANYFKIPEYERERNIIIMWPDGSGRYTKFPMPYGLNVPMNAAAAITHVANGQDPLKEALWLAGSAWNSFSPVGESGWNIVAPTVLDPFVDIALNRNYADRAIMPEENPFEKVPTPDSQRAFGSTHPGYKLVAEKLNELFGGNEQKPGFVDISPETIQHLVETYTGAAGGFLNRVVTWATDPEMETSRKPFIRKFYGEPTPYSVSQSYRDNKANILYYKERLDFLKERAKEDPRNMSAVVKFKTENAEGLALVRDLEGGGSGDYRIKGTEDKLRDLYKDRKKYEAQGNKDKVKEVNEKIEAEQRKFNSKYNAVFLDRGIVEELGLLKLKD